MSRNNEIYGGCNMETYITICKIDTSGNLQYVSENSNRGSVSACRGWVGRNRREVQEQEDICMPVAAEV